MNRNVTVIACKVLSKELEEAAALLNLQIKTCYLPAGLHEEPARLRQELQAAVDELSVPEETDVLVIGYGLCGRGTVGIKAGAVPLIIPRTNDCIALFLGSNKRYRDEFKAHPGTFYFTEGWYKNKTQPLLAGKSNRELTEKFGISPDGYDTLTEKYGKENADHIADFLGSWRKNYTRTVAINTGTRESGVYARYAKSLADELNWQYQDIQGSLDYFLRLFTADRSDSEILYVNPGYITDYDSVQHVLAAWPDGQTRDSLPWERPLPVQAVPEEHHRHSRRGLGLGIDAGGTYTDAVVYDFDSETILAKGKAPTTRWNFTQGILNALEKLPAALLPKIRVSAVSTTLATNAIVEGNGQPVGLILMPPAGIDTTDMRHKPCRVIRGKLTIEGAELEPVDPQQVREIVQELVSTHGVRAFAISGYAGTVNPAHELYVKSLILEITGMGVCCGHELSQKLNFLVRANTAALNAGIIPLLNSFIEDLETAFKQKKISGQIMIVKGDGSLISRERAREHPVETSLSGPAASIAGARYLTGLADCLIIDVGGTTSDIGLVQGNVLKLAEEGARIGSWHTHVRAVEMQTRGLGGDSCIRISGRELTVGPRRTAPLGSLCNEPGVTEALDYLEKHLAEFTDDTAPMEVLAVTGRPAETGLSEIEYQILDILKERPHSIRELAERTGSRLWQFLDTSKLERQALVQRFGLTPTDLLTSGGFISLWADTVSRRVHGFYEALWYTGGLMTEPLASAVFNRIRIMITESLVLQELKVSDADLAREGTASLMKLILHKLEQEGGALSLTAGLTVPLVGVGAAAGFLLKDTADFLKARLIVPADGDVANAVGAISSHVKVSKTAEVLSSSDGRFYISGLTVPGDSSSVVSFPTFHEACDFLEDRLAAVILEEALRAGTEEKQIQWQAENLISPSSQGDAVFLKRSYTAVVSGLPVC